MSSDVRDILDLEGPSTELTKESVLYNRRKIYNEKYKTKLSRKLCANQS